MLNKQDHPLVLSRQEIELVMHLNDLQRTSDTPFAVREVSSIPGVFVTSRPGPDGQTLQVDSAEAVFEWVVAQKCVALGLPVPGRGELAGPGGLFTPKWAATAQVA